MSKSESRSTKSKSSSAEEAQIRELKKKLKEKIKEGEDQTITWFISLLGSVPVEVFYTIFLAWLWSRTHEGPINTGDFIAGAMGALILPNCWGSLTGSAIGASYLTLLGYNFSEDFWKDFGDQITGQSITTPTSPVEAAIQADQTGTVQVHWWKGGPRVRWPRWLHGPP